MSTMFKNLILYALASAALLFIILIRRIYLVRLHQLPSSRIGLFAAHVELYCCEIDAGINVPDQKYIDLFYMEKDVCNEQLAIMWSREIIVTPYFFGLFLQKIEHLMSILEVRFTSLNVHFIGVTQGDRDVNNLLDASPNHLNFIQEEEDRGGNKLRSFGVTDNAKFVCLIVRDSAYLESRPYKGNWSYHNYRDTDIQTYVMAAEELTKMGYFVFRMGAAVNKSIETNNPRIIDYAANGMRNDFMDIYLGAKCDFCISVGTGFDAIPSIFRRPIAYVNNTPLGYFTTWSNRFLLLSQHHYSTKDDNELSLKEIIDRGATLCYSVECYDEKNIKLINNTPEEIRDQVVEMAKRLEGTWIPDSIDKTLQESFWSVFPSDIIGENGQPLHGEVKSLFSASFLRNNPKWVE